MPEGPEIRIAADKIAKAIALKPITKIFFAFEHLKPYEEILAKQLVTTVDTKGKAMLIRFDNGLSIYSHNQLYGKWLICQANNYPQTKRQLRLAIHNEQKSALLYSASDIEVLDENAMQRGLGEGLSPVVSQRCSAVLGRGCRLWFPRRLKAPLVGAVACGFPGV